MSQPMFKYMEWVEVTLDGWHLKDGAPDYVQKAFEEYMQDDTFEIIK